MKKTVNTLNVGDVVFKPEIEKIEEITVREVEKTAKGIRVDLGRYWNRKGDSAYHSAIAITLKYEGYKPVYIRYEDAVKRQKEMRMQEFKNRLTAIKIAQQKADEFFEWYIAEPKEN